MSAPHGSKISVSTARRRKKTERLQRILDGIDQDALSQKVSALTLDADNPSLYPIARNLESHSENKTPLVDDLSDNLEYAQDLQHIRVDFAQRRLSLPFNSKMLAFIHNPETSGSYIFRDITTMESVNSGPHALRLDHADNIVVLDHETWLFTTYLDLVSFSSVADNSINDARQKLMDDILQDFERLEKLKQMEWEIQEKTSGPWWIAIIIWILRDS
ncbi:hypothetical protein A0H81_03656 [Grifola frondosa]|uniref:Uncharacterized protein n=1 Tax=Grifola frondosa TaxID=5627 RepID=A0A1C7MJN4_GRIFR|nr:hypothetical protein A0H81_03656 [Grifola frondosa]